jgi:ABC-type antimicrobial peptide transport system permease subunit
VPLDVGFGSPTWRIVGVAGDIRSRGLRLATAAAIYVPHGQYGPRRLTVTVRGTPGSASVLPAIEDHLRSLDARLPMYRVHTLEEALEREVAPTRFYLVLVGLFAALAATLAAIGLYGVVAFVASRRTQEIGLRVALGAGRTGVVSMIVGQGLRPALIGLAVGLVGALFCGRLFEAVLFGVRPRDPVIFSGTALLLGLVALTASVLPALRAAHVDPVRALRSD